MGQGHAAYGYFPHEFRMRACRPVWQALLSCVSEIACLCCWMLWLLLLLTLTVILCLISLNMAGMM